MHRIKVVENYISYEKLLVHMSISHRSGARRRQRLPPLKYYNVLKCPVGKICMIFFKNRCPTSNIRRWGKNRMRRHTVFCSYCRYYSSYYYRMTTVVTTVATRHGITMSLYHVG